RVYQQLEIPTGPFRRVVELQVEVDAEKASATYEDGVLRIELPLRDPEETTRRGPIGRGEMELMEGSPVLEVGDVPVDIEEAVRTDQPLPEALPVLPLRETVTYPETLTPLAVGQERSIQLVNDVLGGNRMLVMVASRDAELERPGPADLYDVGVAGFVARMIKIPDGSLRVLVQGMQRVGLGGYVAEQPYLVARIEALPDVLEAGNELEALARNVQRTFSEIVEQIPYLPEELQLAVTNIEDPSALAHLIAGSLRIPLEEKQQL